MEPLDIRLLEQDYQPIMEQAHKAMYYCAQQRNLVLIKAHDSPEDVESVINGTINKPYNHLLNVLNTQTDVVAYWHKTGGTITDYDIYYGRDTAILATLKKVANF